MPGFTEGTAKRAEATSEKGVRSEERSPDDGVAFAVPREARRFLQV